MHSTFRHEMATARIADLHDHAAQERVAQAARRLHKQRRTRPVPSQTVTSLARRALTLAGGRSSSPTR